MIATVAASFPPATEAILVSLDRVYLLLQRAGSHSITYLCNNITAQEPSKQPCSQMKPAASTAECSSGVIVLWLLVGTCVHISVFSHSYVACYTLNSNVILTWSTRTVLQPLALSVFWGCFPYCVLLPWTQCCLCAFALLLVKTPQGGSCQVDPVKQQVSLLTYPNILFLLFIF